MKIWLIQGIISPYRIKLFENIARTEGVDFKLILLSKGLRCVPQWDFSLDEMSFKAERVPGWCFYTSYENQICINPVLLIKMLREKPDVVICAGFSLATLLVLLYKLITKHPYVIWNEGTHHTESKHSIFRKSLRRILSRFSSVFIVAGSLSKKYLESLLPEFHQKPFFISYNCTDNQLFSATCKQFRSDKKFRSRFPERNILYVGRLTEKKGVRQLLQVYDKLISKFSEPVGLILVGDGPLRSYIENENKNHNWEYVFLEGFIPYQELPKYYAIADVFILLTLYDRNPLVIFEALACGVPFICSERAGNAVDFVIDGENGYIVDPMNISDIAQKTIKLLELEDSKKEKITKISRRIVQKANYNDSTKAFIDACRMSLRAYGADKE